VRSGAHNSGERHSSANIKHLGSRRGRYLALPNRRSVTSADLSMPPGTVSDPVSRHYFSCISFVTDFTPPTALATLTASLISSRELTEPLN
jgi:hypothetical protein